MYDIEKIQTVTKANIEAWDEVAPIHAKQNHARLLESFRNPGFLCLDQVETKRLETLGIKGKDVAQICCNNGRELISYKRMGAARCVGFDGSQKFIDQARELANAASLNVEFICTNVYDIRETDSGQFDILIVTIGVLNWMPDLMQFFAILQKLIIPGGALFIYESHPILDMIAAGDAGEPIVWELPYFNKTPYTESDGLDYYGGEPYDAKPVTSFSHTLSSIITAGLRNKLAVEHFEELPYHIANTWWNVEASDIGLPMSYTLVFRK